MTTALLLAEVRMGAADYRRARVAALARMGQNLVVGRADAYGATGQLALHIDGALAELAFARMLGVGVDQWAAYTNGALADLDADVAGWQVRSTRHPDGCLIIHPRDHQGARFALVVHNGVTFRAAGWLVAAEARQPQHWRQLAAGHAAAWCVPQDQLRPFD